MAVINGWFFAKAINSHVWFH